MTLVSEVVTLLEADSGAGGVATLCTGGIYDWEVDLDEEGLSEKSAPSAYNTTTGTLKPTCVVRARTVNHDGGIADDVTKVMSGRQVLELWFYNDKDSGHATNRSAAARAKAVLHGTATSSGYIPRWIGHPIQGARAIELNQATMLRSDYDVRSIE